MQPANRDFTREVNLFNILNTIREAGSISRVEIAARTGQSRSSVTNITALLLEQGLIRENQNRIASSRGRRRIMLALNPEAAYAVGVKIAAVRLSFAVVDFVGQVKSSFSIPFRVDERSTAMLADVVEDGILHCLDDARLKPEVLIGCGLAIPGFVDSASGVCHWSPIQKGGSNIRELLADRLQMEVFLENDANAFTVASQWFGLGKGVRNYLVVTIEEGVGMGIVVDGKLYQGASGIGAEFGHMVMDPEGEPCRCGKRGCIEAYSADSGIMQQARKLLEKRRSAPELDMLNIEEVTRLAKNGDRGLRSLFKCSGEFLGRGIAGLIQIFNPELIIVTGEGVRAGDMVFKPMYRQLKKLVNKPQAQATEVVVQEWNDHDWAQGAAGLVLSEVYKSPLDRIKNTN